MKKLLILITFFLGFASTNYASDTKLVDVTVVPGELNVKSLNGLRFILKIENVEQNTFIEIIDKDGILYHSEYAAKNLPFVKVYNLSNLPDGEFYFKVTNGKEVLTKSFTIETETKRNVSEK